MTADGTALVPAPDVLLRPATPSDLPRVGEIFAATQDADSRPPSGSVPSLYHHELAGGELFVAEREGRVVGFAALLTRGSVHFLADLFVDPDEQSSGLGSRLLEHVLPRDRRPRCTLASSDPRALGLYVRAGMRPYVPVFQLRGNLATGRGPAAGKLEVVDARPGDPDLLDWDRAIGGRPRPQDHAYWIQHRGGVPFWLVRDGTRVGYGYIQTYSDDLPDPAGIVTLGPIGVRDPSDAEPSLLAAVRWASRQKLAMRLSVPGCHPALGSLIALGLRIYDTSYYCSSRQPRFADLRRYLPSGGDLF